MNLIRYLNVFALQDHFNLIYIYIVGTLKYQILLLSYKANNFYKHKLLYMSYLYILKNILVYLCISIVILSLKIGKCN